ncbi:hypothetical protein [Persephonella sp.]
MRYIDISKLPQIMGEENFKEWEIEAERHLDKLKDMTHEERAEYLRKNNIWTKLHRYLAELSHNKCWYSEAPANSSEWDIDHYRPKNRSKDINGKVILEDGYWWLAYDWTNYRLTGSLINRRRKDKLSDSEEVGGKGDFFPVYYKDKAGNLEEEIPLILDPCNPRDPSLLTFDIDGNPIPAIPKSQRLDYLKVCVSIKLLNLKNEQLRRLRKQTWENCERKILEALNRYKEIKRNPMVDSNEKTTSIRNIIEILFKDLYLMLDDSKPFTSVVRACIKYYSNEHPELELKLFLGEL